MRHLLIQDLSYLLESFFWKYNSVIRSLQNLDSSATQSQANAPRIQVSTKGQVIFLRDALLHFPVKKEKPSYNTTSRLMQRRNLNPCQLYIVFHRDPGPFEGRSADQPTAPPWLQIFHLHVCKNSWGRAFASRQVLGFFFSISSYFPSPVLCP